MNPAALYDALNTMSVCVLAAEGGRFAEAETAWLEAGLAAPEAFPPRSPQGDALNLILRAVGDMALGRLA